VGERISVSGGAAGPGTGARVLAMRSEHLPPFVLGMSTDLTCMAHSGRLGRPNGNRWPAGILKPELAWIGHPRRMAKRIAQSMEIDYPRNRGSA
jgi:hypothetical protein